MAGTADNRGKQVRRGFKGWLVLLLCTLVLSGCAVRFFYNQLDWLIPWYLDDYIELQGPQKDLFKSRLDDYLTWHRQSQLPKYADFLESLAVHAEKGLTRTDIADVQTRTQTLAQALVDRLKPDMIELFAMASDEQVKDLFSKFAEDDARYRKEYLEQSLDEQRRQRAKEVRHYVERWTGTLDDKQWKLIKRWSESFDPMGDEIFAVRQVWQAEFHRILQMRHDRPAYDQAFATLLDTPTYGRTAALQQKMDSNEQALIELYLALDASLSSDQRAHMVKKLRSYAADFRSLATQAN